MSRSSSACHQNVCLPRGKFIGNNKTCLQNLGGHLLKPKKTRGSTWFYVDLHRYAMRFFVTRSVTTGAAVWHPDFGSSFHQHKTRRDRFKWGFPIHGGTPKSSIFIGFSILNHLFWGTPSFANLQIENHFCRCWCHCTASNMLGESRIWAGNGSENLQILVELASHHVGWWGYMI